jgi:hypothetical protein
MKFFDERIEKGLLARLTHVMETPFVRVSYTEAIKILEKAIAGGRKFDYPVKWGTDLQSEHERWLAEKHVKGPLVLMNYPKEIKAFYMRLNDDGKTVAAMDVLPPVSSTLAPIISVRTVIFSAPEATKWKPMLSMISGGAENKAPIESAKLLATVLGASNLTSTVTPVAVVTLVGSVPVANAVAAKQSESATAIKDENSVLRFITLPPWRKVVTC